MDLGLKGKTAAVMAASEGLGRAAALALAREGADVAICARREAPLRATAKAIADETGARVVPIVADLSRSADVERFINAAASDLRGLDILVVNAGGPPAGDFEKLPDEAWLAAHELTLMSAVRAIRHALPHFRTEKGGSVVGIQSSSVKQPIEDLILSNSLRLAVVGLFKTLATQHAKDNIRFNLVLPGLHATARLERLGGMEERAKSIPIRRIGDPQDFGDVVAWLASDRARYVTGTTLQVDGGLVRYPL